MKPELQKTVTEIFQMPLKSRRNQDTSLRNMSSDSISKYERGAVYLHVYVQ